MVPQALPIPLPFPHIFQDDCSGALHGSRSNGTTNGAVLSAPILLMCPWVLICQSFMPQVMHHKLGHCNLTVAA